MSMALKDLHDELLEKLPEGVDHDTANCPFCDPTSGNTISDPDEGGDMSGTTFTQDELDAAVAEAVKPLNDKIKDLLDASEQSDLEARHAQELSELQVKLDELETKLDAKELELTSSKEEFANLTSFLEETARLEQEAADAAARRESRLAIVREVANFKDEYINERADRWSALSDEAFEDLVNDWKAITPAKDEGEGLPSQTAMDTASRETTGKRMSAVTEILALNGSFDPRTL